MGNPGIPLSVISKAAEMQLLYAVDKVILGNRWLRKATGIQPKFPYMVDSFEKRYVYCHSLVSPIDYKCSECDLLVCLYTLKIKVSMAEIYVGCEGFHEIIPGGIEGFRCSEKG